MDTVPVELPFGSEVVGIAVGENSVTILFKQSFSKTLSEMQQIIPIKPDLEALGESVSQQLETTDGEIWVCEEHGPMPLSQKGGHISYYHAKGGLKTAQKNNRRRATTAKSRSVKRRTARKR